MFKKIVPILIITMCLSSTCKAADHYVASNEQGDWYLQTETVKSLKTNVNVWLTYCTKTVDRNGYTRIETQALVSKSGPPMYRFKYFQIYNSNGELIDQYVGDSQWLELIPNTLGYSICNLASKIVYEGG